VHGFITRKTILFIGAALRASTLQYIDQDLQLLLDTSFSKWLILTKYKEESLNFKKQYICTYYSLASQQYLFLE
jgi:hypothetical protein